MYTIRPYTSDDYETIKQWWSAAGEPAPTASMHPLETTFILEVDNTPALCLSVILTNCKDFVLFENFVGNPEFRGEKRRAAGKAIMDAAFGFTKSMGYARVLGLCKEPKLVERYREFGFIPVNSQFCLCREIK